MLRLILLIASLLSLSLAQVLIGDLSRRQHNVSGTVFAINSRTLRITNFYYDGLGPAGAFWIDTGSLPSSAGRTVPFRDTCVADEQLRRFSGETVELELPPDITLDDVGYLSVWCVSQKAEFGGIAIDTDELDPILALEEATCPTRSQEDTTNVIPVKEGWNCEPLAGNFQVRWRVVENRTKVDFELVARLRDGDQWMSFGLSGSDERSFMDGGDVALAYRRDDKFFAIDYHLQPDARRPCDPPAGVCPDTLRNQTDGVDDILDVSGDFKDGLTVVRYSRRVKGTNPDLDKDINVDGTSFVIWAIGPLNINTQQFFPQYHVGPLSHPLLGDDVTIEFGREPVNNCQRGFDIPSEDPADVPGFERPVLYNVTSITARIGPSGGVRGVPAILNRTSWGIAWYLSETGPDNEDILIPALGVERGKTYEFSIFGGIPAADDDTSVHPLYITSSSRGGYEQRTPKQRADETVYAGIRVTERNGNGGVVAYESSAGALCLLGTNLTDTAALATYEDFSATLNRSCTENAAIASNGGKLKWKVEEDTPDTVYYQCVTHENLGFKIRVFDAGKIDVAELREMSGGGPLPEAEEETAESCVVDFKNERKFFSGCVKGVGDAVDIYWNVDEEAGEIETLFQAPKGDGDIGYVGLAWGSNSMVGSNAVIAFDLQDGGTRIGDYFLEARNTAGVQPNTMQNLKSAEAESTEEYLSGLFTRKLVVDGLPPIRAEGQTDFIWAVGRRPQSAREFTTHFDSAPAKVDLSVRSEAQVFEEASRLDTIFVVHAVFMGVSWLLLVPLAITAIRFFKKYNPITFNIHRGLNGAAAVLTVAGFIMAITSGSRTETAHLVIGCIVFSVVILQALAGVLRPGKDKKLRKPWYWGHSIVGSLLVGLGIANCFIGIGTNKIGGPVGWYIAAGVVTGLIVALQIVFALMPNTFPREDEEEAKSRLREERVKSGGGRTFVRDD